MRHTHPILILISLFTLYTLSLADLDESGTQFISYNGSISGTFKHSEQFPDCPTPTYYFSSLENALVKVGANPPWDTNPFYFNIQHNGQQVSTYDSDEYCFSLGGCTYDSIYNLFLETAWYRCLADDGSSCEFIEWDYYFEPVEILDLNLATTASIGDGNEEKGYSTIGDQSSFVKNNLVSDYSMDFQRPHNYTERDECVETLTFEWNTTTPFTYALNFTNTSAQALFSLTAPSGTVEFFFSGLRVDGGQSSTSQTPEVDPYNNGNYTPISLNASGEYPSFTFVNGSGIGWKNHSDGWDATASSAVLRVEIENIWKQLMAISGMMLLGMTLN
ncbi:uncharacterized protein N7484_002088 [Penicillium longicatenatum]|uniref:uncharacterized protein n=1 Tax=Penicillium longicatenatum TaxID=1561947 RepID=UPI00254729D9|nr:uncharacterized protein N7484_002088 [Penicillium longicatenatum]KAJ5658439.1 hypothetical protein N7484_002088 [Penicillium longicatenatum]